MRSPTRCGFGVLATLVLLPTRAHADEPAQPDEEMVTVERPASAPADVPRPWPRGKDEPPPPKPVREGPRGSGGIAVTALRGWRNGRGDTPIAGAHATAAWRFGHTRFGATMGLQHDAGLLLSKKYVHEVHGSGPSGRLGGMIGWGAPWNDTFIGFMGEAGVTAGMASGASDGKTITTTYASPYGGAWLMLQVPWRLPVRPVAGLGMLWTPNIPDSLPVSIMCELGVVWQAW
jgi:hypothetical protein